MLVVLAVGGDFCDRDQSGDGDDNFCLAVLTGKVLRALAYVSVGLIGAGSAVHAWVVRAIISVDLARFTFESNSACAGVESDVVDALSVVMANSGSAVVDVGLAYIAFPSKRALASE